MMIEDVLVDLGYTSVDVVVSQASAIDAAQQRCPDLITADDKLTSGSGIEAVRIICKHMPIPVIFITGNPRELSGEGIIHLAKPFKAQELEEAVPKAKAAARTFAQ